MFTHIARGETAVGLRAGDLLIVRISGTLPDVQQMQEYTIELRLTTSENVPLAFGRDTPTFTYTGENVEDKTLNGAVTQATNMVSAKLAQLGFALEQLSREEFPEQWEEPAVQMQFRLIANT